MTLKKSLLLISGILSVTAITVLFSGIEYNYCPTPSIPCTDWINDFVLNLAIFLPILIFSLITYKIPERIYGAWMYFALPWTALSLVLVFITPEFGSGGGFGPALSIDKSDVALIMSSLFVLISTLIIAGMYLRDRMNTKTV